MNDIQRLHPNARLSKAVSHGGTIYLCGQTAKGSAAAEGAIDAQMQEVLARVDGLLQEAGSSRAHILAATIYLRDIGADFAGMNAVWESWMPAGQAPARTTVEAKLATASLLVEMTVIAALV